MSEKSHEGRLTGVVILLLLAFAGLEYRLVSLHTGTSDRIRHKVQNLRNLKKTISCSRGMILDSRGSENILALDLSKNDIVADPTYIVENGKVEKVTAALAPILGKDPAHVMALLDQPGCRFECLERFAPEEKVRRLKELDLPGIYFREARLRQYPLNSFMCHVIGFANNDGIGGAGIEQSMNGFLRGCPGWLESQLDARRHEMPDKRTRDIPPIEGADVALNLDQQIQYILEKALDDVMVEHRAKAAWAIVERVKTGEILAMAVRPCYNLNEFNKSTDEQRMNRAIGQNYEPGSTIKIVTFSAAFEEKLVTPSDIIDCENGAWLWQRHILKDYHPYGLLSVEDCIKKSSNIAAAKLSVMLGDRRLASYLRKFGIGVLTGIDLPGEENGILHPVEKWSGLSSSRIGIGQGVAVTSIQVLNAICAIANDGILMRPYVVKRVTSREGAVLYEGKATPVRRVISSETAALMRRLLARVTEEGGTGRRASVEGYPVAGKTGTAQKPVGGGYSQTDYVSSFVGFFPADKPEVGIIVVVDEPQPLHTGGIVAAPVFAKIAGLTARYLDLPASQPASQVAATTH